MNAKKLVFWIRVLWLTVGAVALMQAAVFLFELFRGENSSHQKLLHLIQTVLAGCEIVAALLFLVPRTCLFGVWSLVAVFLFAILLHVAHGDFNVGSLLFYAAAALVVEAYKSPIPTNADFDGKEESK